MDEFTQFPRTTVGGISMPRMVIGTNWLLGYSHTSVAKDKFIVNYHTKEHLVQILSTFMERGVDAIINSPYPKFEEVIHAAEDRTGRQMIRLITPTFNIVPGGEPELEPERMLDLCAKLNATFCLPHQCVTDALVDRMTQEIRHLGRYTKMMRERGLIPGLSTHMPESVVYADRMGADVETYLQIYNAAGFLMQVEVDWVMRIIRKAQKPVLTIKPLAAGRLLPVVGLTFVWSTIRDIDMVAVGVTTPDEAREVIDISLDLLSRRIPDNPLQKTRSKKSLE